MKLNFWQWLGIIIIAVAVIMIGYRELTKNPKTPPNTPNPSINTPSTPPDTAPSTVPATVPSN